MDILKEKIKQHLLCRDFFDLTVTDEVSSTNAVVKEWGSGGKKEGTVLLARHQTAGRGRLGRSFYSPVDSGVYFSILLRPNLKPEKALLITTAAAVAVAEAIGKDAKIKWVNDIFVNHRKVCGILTESALKAGELDFAVLGIGLNLTAPATGFPDEIKNIAGGVFEQMPPQQTVARLVADILNRFYELYQDLESPEMVAAYGKRNLLKGKTVTAGAIVGIAEGIDEAFHLLVRDKTGCLHTLSAGEVTIGSKRFDL